MHRTWLTRLLVFSACVLAQTPSLWACPMCKMALDTDDPQPRAYMTSILFMLGTITTMLGSVTGMLFWVSRHERKTLTEAGYEHVLQNGVNTPDSDAVP